MVALRRYRIWAGEMSYREMAHQCGGTIGASTLCTALGSDELPTLGVVLAVVTACGGSEQHQKHFATAWRKLRLAREEGAELRAGTAEAPRVLRPVTATA